MLEEVGTVVRIEPDALWVETLQKSACGSCSAQKGCGQHALGKVLATSSSIRVLLQGQPAESFHLNQDVVIGIPEDVVVRGALMVYLVPLFLMIVFAWGGYQLAPTDGFSAFCAVLGLLLGGGIIHWHSRKTRNDPRLQPVLLSTSVPRPV